MRTLVVLADESNKEAVLKEVAQMTRKFKLLAETYGYEMNDALWCDGNFKLNFYPIEKFSPKIYVNQDIWGDDKEKPTFEIQTTSYGALKPEEYKIFLESCKKAYDLVEYFNGLSLQELKDYFPTIEFAQE